MSHWTNGLLTALLFSFGAHASDVICRPFHMADRGYEIEMNKTSVGTYAGHLNQLRIYGKISKYRGAIQLELLKPSPGCVLKVSGAFDLRISENDGDYLVSVDGKPVAKVDENIKCETSAVFDEDAARLCGN